MTHINVLLVLLWTTAALAQETGKRVALVIGNDAYKMSPLKNAVNDAKAMEKVLTASGFRVTLLENGKKAEMDEKIGVFLDTIGPDDTVLFFYAGHGVQIDSENFLVPVDFVPETLLTSAKFRSVSVAPLLEELNRKRPKKTIIILDACRSNPVADKYSLTRGLAQPQNAGREAYVAFSTGPGQVASDNRDGRNSWFTEALADFVSQTKPQLELNEIFNRVKRRVSDATDGRQVPWTISNLTGSFYFHAPAGGRHESDATVAEKWLQDALRREQQGDWSEAIERLNQILNLRPNGALAEAAKQKLPYLKARREADEAFDAQRFGIAAKTFDSALEKDAFAIDAAFNGVNSYLLNNELAEAVRLLKAIRIRGTSAAFAKANAMLKALAAVFPDAGQELKATVVQPPPVNEMFPNLQLGAPDWNAADRVMLESPELARAVKEVIAMFPKPKPVSVPLPTQTLAGEPVFYVKIILKGESRDFRIRVPGAKQAPESPRQGIIRLDGPPLKIPIFQGAEQVAQEVPVSLAVPAGTYEISIIQNGKPIFNDANLEVTPLGTQIVQVSR